MPRTSIRPKDIACPCCVAAAIWAITLDMSESAAELDLNAFHGKKTHCPGCYSLGTFDANVAPEKNPEFQDAIWYNRDLREFECNYCCIQNASAGTAVPVTHTSVQRENQ